MTTDKCKTLLIQAICNIFMKCKDNKYRLVSLLGASTEAKETESEMQADIVQSEEAVTPDTDAKMIVSKWLF